MTVNKAIICLGANTPDAAERLARAFSALSIMGAIVDAVEPYLTAPEYAGETEPYLNQIVVLATYMSFDELTARTKDYQTKTRAANPYSPLVNIDIDIVEWNGEIVRPTDAAAAYYRQGIARLANLSMSGAL